MKIIDVAGPSIKQLKDSEPAAKAEEAKKRARKDGQGAQSDRVEISDQSRLATKAQGVVKATPEVRTERVEALKAQVESGEYEVDPDKVAEKIVDEHLSELT